MKDITENFKHAVVAELNGLAERFDLGPAEVGEERLIASSIIDGFGGDGNIHPPILGIVKRQDGISVEVRNVCFVGSRGALPNRAVTYLMSNIFRPPQDDEDSPGSDQFELGGLMVDMFRSERRTTDDLVAMVVAASNATTIYTSASIDFSDGEVIVDIFLPCDFERVPEDFDESIGMALRHAALINRMNRIIRDLMSPDNLPAPRTMANLFEKIRSNGKAENVEPAEREVVEEVTL